MQTAQLSIGASKMLLVRRIGIRLGLLLSYKQTGATSRFHLWKGAPDLVNVKICRTIEIWYVGLKTVDVFWSFGSCFGSR